MVYVLESSLGAGLWTPQGELAKKTAMIFIKGLLCACPFLH